MKKTNDQVLVEIPDIAKDILPEPENLNFYKLYQKRIIYVIEDAGKPIEERVPVKIFVFSQGGEDQASWNFVDFVAASKTPVYTVNAGMCLSNGLTLLMAGHKRFALKHSTGMYHSGSARIEGIKEQVDAATKYIASQDKIYEKWFLDHCKIDQKLFNRKKKTDWYMTADEMLEYGIIDKIIDSLDEVI